jgi:putative sterol carrier protein
MTDPTRHFFDQLARRGHEPLLEKAKGTLRFDLRQKGRTDRWLLTLDDGDITVSHKGGPATCVVRTDRAVFDGIAVGDVNAAAAVIRGAAEVEGDSELLVMFQRLLPGPQRRPAPTTSEITARAR